MNWNDIRKLCLLTTSLCVLAAQFPTAVRAQRNVDVNAGGGNLPIQRIGVDDLVAIQVYDSPELTRTERMRQDGMLRLPLLTKPVKAAGLFPSDLEESLTEELKTEGILVRPIVSVSVSEYRSRPISVVGAVRHPLTFQAYGNVTLLDALTRADGISDAAGSEIIVSRPAARTAKRDCSSACRLKRSWITPTTRSNIKLSGGEEIRVPEGGRVFVMGNVRKPGAIPVHDLSELTVLRVIAQSDGLLPFAAKDAFHPAARRCPEERNFHSASENHGSQSAGRAADGERRSLCSGQ